MYKQHVNNNYIIYKKILILSEFIFQFYYSICTYIFTKILQNVMKIN